MHLCCGFKVFFPQLTFPVLRSGDLERRLNQSFAIALLSNSEFNLHLLAFDLINRIKAVHK